MPDKVFVDTSVLLRLYQDDSAKSQQVKNILSGNECVLSTQVVEEMTRNLLQKAAYTEAEIRSVTESLFRDFEVKLPGRKVYLRASELRVTQSLSFGDSLAVASALEAGCKVLCSETLPEGTAIEGLSVRNPFRNS